MKKNNILLWEGSIEQSIADCAGVQLPTHNHFRITLDTDDCIFLEQRKLDKLNQPSWQDVSENDTKLENAIFTQCIYDKVIPDAKLQEKSRIREAERANRWSVDGIINE